MVTNSARRRARRRVAVLSALAVDGVVAAVPAHSADEPPLRQRQSLRAVSSPAIGNLFDMFDFGHQGEKGTH